MKAVTKKQTPRQLKPKESKFIQLLMDTTDTRSIKVKAQEAGYSESYGYNLYHLPHIQEALKQEIELEEEQLRLQRYRVKQTFANDAQDKKLAPVDRHRAGELFCKTQGDIASGGQVNVTNVQANGGKQSSFVDRVRAGAAQRFPDLIEPAIGSTSGEDAE